MTLMKWLLAALGACAGIAVSGAAYAQTVITVTTGADNLAADGECSLREAVEAANTDAAVDACPAGGTGMDVIVFAGSVTTVTMSLGGSGEDGNQSGDIDIWGWVWIRGEGRVRVIGGASFDDRVFDVHSEAVLEGLTIARGNLAGGNECGGGITVRAGASLALRGSTVTDNHAEGSGGGLCVRSSGVATVTSSSLVSNTAKDGGGIYNRGTMWVYTATIAYNRAVTTPTSFGQGGGAFNSGWLLVSDSVFHDNVALFDDSTGGIYNYGTTARLEAVNTTLSGNGDVGLYNDLGARASLTHVTVFGHSQYGLWRSSGVVTAFNTLVANNYRDCQGSIQQGGRSLSSDFTCTLFALRGINPMLGPLASNGGPTLNHAPAVGSPALDNAGGCGASTDQRGVARPQGTQCDIGAYEREAVDLAIAKVAAPAPVTATGVVTYTLIVTNQSSIPAPNVVVTDRVTQGGELLAVVSVTPSSTSVQTSSRGLTVSIATLPPQATLLITYTVRAGTEGSIVNEARTSSSMHDSPSANNAVSVAVPITAVAHLTASKHVTYQPSPFGGVIAGGVVSYTILVTNTGPSAAASVVMTDVMPSGVTALSVTADAPWVCTLTPAQVTCTAGTLPVGGYRIEILAQAPLLSGFSFVNVAVIDSPTEPPGETQTPPVQGRTDQYLFIHTAIVPSP